MSQLGRTNVHQAVRNRYAALVVYAPLVPVASTPPVQGGQVALKIDEIQKGPSDTAEVPKEEKSEEVEEGEEERELLQLGKFSLPPPSPLSLQETYEIGLEAIERMFAVVDQFDKTSLISRKSKLGANRLAASNWDREGWITVLTRLATRGMGSAPEEPTATKRTENGPEASPPMIAPSALSTAIREKLYNFVIADFRGRMDVAVSWLNEEWYNDQVMAKTQVNREPQYRKWMMKVMDGIFPFLESKDRLFMRLLSEIPEVTVELMQKVKMLCLDPDRAMLGIQMLQLVVLGCSFFLSFIPGLFFLLPCGTRQLTRCIVVIWQCLDPRSEIYAWTSWKTCTRIVCAGPPSSSGNNSNMLTKS